jgi:hypothetical protein
MSKRSSIHPPIQEKLEDHLNNKVDLNDEQEIPVINMDIQKEAQTLSELNEPHINEEKGLKESHQKAEKGKIQR